ncbi:TIGR04255 family protein [Pseudomonas peli]|uniref:TIGR04255 family protein n=1 Tax=Pseudomonas peli TaxID=592361 RepID=A0AB37ZE10_9PSED|nr:TIGR04255 family protein [Pseudomonas peli]NMZ70971.1 TIGR04255 family protein [Pseudomonas peli]SCW81899.1 TIGR04255 family protein [Pseudomonas peli]
MNARLPNRLGKSPLVDAIFEIRFDGEPLLSSILTGVLYSTLGCTKVEKLPHADLPDFVRQSDPNLKYLILSRLTWGNYYIGIGDNVLTLSPMQPYPGWGKFREKINSVLHQLNNFSAVHKADRFSFKYIDILEDKIHEDIFETLNIGLSLLERNFNSKTLQVRVEIPQDESIHVVQVTGHALATLPDGSTRSGIMVDIDSIMQISKKTKDESFEAISTLLDTLHQENKELFFKLLTDEGFKRMEPVYD